MTAPATPRPARGAWALPDDAVLAAVKARLLGALDDPARLGRYEIEGILGAGAMGRILLARDPRLDRRVALKLIAPHLVDDPVARARIVQEARAMAKLSDPHVAQVYEVAEDDAHLFVAMEHVDGQPLSAWLDERPRSWARVVEVFVQAGRGLAATHAKGLAHRDFKPDNVMLERGGRAKVVDFGLACDFAEPDVAHTPSPDAPATLTATGAWLGTPAYMAPEQWDGGRVDARSDQFSFCVALYEALAGRRPFEGRSASATGEALARGHVPPLARRLRIPRRIEAAIRRGLAIDPEQRWPAMEPLLHALDPRARVRAAVVLPATAVAAAAVAAVVLVADRERCDTAGAAMDALWSHQHRDHTEQAMLAVDAPWAAATSAAVLPHLDAAAVAWRDAAQAVCAAEDGRTEPARCLAHARVDLAEAIERAASGDVALLVDAAAQAELLPDARACLQPSAVAWLREDAAPEGEQAAAARRAWRDAARSLGELSTMAGADHYVASLAAGRAAAGDARARAEAAGDRPQVAASAWLMGRLALRDSDREAAERALREARDVSLEVGALSLHAAATVELLYVVGNHRDRTAEAMSLARDAEAMLAALGERPLWSARLASHRASVFAHADPPQPERAVELHRATVAVLERVLGDSHPDVIVERGNLGAALSQAQRFDEARAQLEQACARAREVWGEGHPRTARLEGTLGWALAQGGHLEGARRHLERSLRARAAALGDDHDEVASARYNLAIVLRQQGDHAQAVEQLAAGLRARERARGPDDAGHAEWLQRIGISELALGRTEAARASLHRALELSERWGASRDRFANLHVALARAYADDDPAKARVLAELARRERLDDPRELAMIDALLAELAEAGSRRQ